MSFILVPSGLAMFYKSLRIKLTLLSLTLFFVDLHNCSPVTSISTNPWTFPGGLAFPYGGEGGGDTRYKNDYRCEGDVMTIGCEDVEGDDLRIEVVRGNFGRFSIAICNQHGQTDWSVNCMSPSTTKRLKAKCDGLKSCKISVNSESFPEDSCPGTFKYLEVHYACTSNSPDGSHKKPPPPPWFNPWINNNTTTSESTTSSTPRKPILVTEKIQTASERIPITTPTSDIEHNDKEEKEAEKVIKISKEKVLEQTSLFNQVVDTKVPALEMEINDNMFANIEGNSGRSLSTKSPFLSTLGPSNLNTPQIIISKTGIETKSNNLVDSVTTLDGINSCPPITARNLQWNPTKRGEFAIQPCPIGTTGLARWGCSIDGIWTGESPDMSDCKAVAMSNLEAQVRQEDPENVLISSLAYLTRTKSLYGGDLESAVTIMRTVANLIQYRLQSRASSFHNKESLIQEVLQNVLRSVSHILETTNYEAWTDLSIERQMKVATSLLLSLEENAFLYAGILNEPKTSVDSSELLTMAIYVMPLVGRVGHHIGAHFPPRKLLFVDDSIELSESDVVSSAGSHRLAEIVFFSFSNLHTILNRGKITITNSLDNRHEPVENDLSQNYQINSRVISASIGRGGRHLELLNPVTITLRHLRTNESDPICLFWNYESHGWSDQGCWLQNSNLTHSVCQCNHLTHFALASRPSRNYADWMISIIPIISVISVLIIISIIGFILILMKFRRHLKKCILHKCCCGSRNGSENRGGGPGGEMEKCQRNFYTGLSPNTTNSSSSTNSTKVMTSLNERVLSQYVMSNHQQLQGGTVLVTSTATTPSGTLATSSNTMGSKRNGTASTISSGVPHITLNPYSSQLLDNINLMMPGNTPKSAAPPQDKQEVVYRAVSPHGHVYWEIDPQTAAAAAVAANAGNNDYYYSEANNLEIDDGFRRNLAPEQHPLISIHRQNIHQQQLQQRLHLHQQRQKQQQFQPPTTLSTSSTYFNTQQRGRNTPLGGGATMGRNILDYNGLVPEQLQRQVQIRDVKAIPVSVKSSEYIEAKIRTLRANNNSSRKNSNMANTLGN